MGTQKNIKGGGNKEGYLSLERDLNCRGRMCKGSG